MIQFTNDCICDRHKTRIVEPVKITDTRTELRCADCKGLMGWWDDEPKTKKLIPPKRKWTKKELEELV